MPRTWGYIIIVAAIAVGAGSVLLPMPETIEVTPVEAPQEAAPRPAVSAPPRVRTRPQEPPAAAQAPTRTAKPAVKPVPMQDTTKTRQMITPKPAQK